MGLGVHNKTFDVGQIFLSWCYQRTKNVRTCQPIFLHQVYLYGLCQVILMYKMCKNSEIDFMILNFGRYAIRLYLNFFIHIRSRKHTYKHSFLCYKPHEKAFEKQVNGIQESLGSFIYTKENNLMTMIE